MKNLLLCLVFSSFVFLPNAWGVKNASSFLEVETQVETHMYELLDKISQPHGEQTCAQYIKDNKITPETLRKIQEMCDQTIEAGYPSDTNAEDYDDQCAEARASCLNEVALRNYITASLKTNTKKGAEAPEKTVLNSR